jgi:hypothetical protein
MTFFTILWIVGFLVIRTAICFAMRIMVVGRMKVVFSPEERAKYSAEVQDLLASSLKQGRRKK